MKRALKDFASLSNPLNTENGIYAKLVGDDIRKIYMMLVGPIDSPYEGALFFFTIEYEKQFYTPVGTTPGIIYPFAPPKVVHYSSSAIRVHPNLYTPCGGGKCCLSILGTWSGPGWSAMMTFDVIAQTILSILDKEPLRNEPGYSSGNSPHVKEYTNYIQYVTIRET